MQGIKPIVIVLAAGILVLGVVVVTQMGGGAEAGRAAPDLVRGEDGRVREQVGAVSVAKARTYLKSPDTAIREKGTMAYARAVMAERASLPMTQRIPTTQETAPLVSVATGDSSDAVRATAVTAMGQMRAYREADTFFKLMNDGSPLVRTRAVAAFTRVYGMVPAFKANDPPAKREADIKKLAAFSDALVSSAAEYYQSGRHLKPEDRKPAP